MPDSSWTESAIEGTFPPLGFVGVWTGRMGTSATAALALDAIDRTEPDKK